MGPRLAATLALAALGCASPGDAFVGSYEGALRCSGTFSDGTPTHETQDIVVRIDRALDGSLYLAAEVCSPRLDVIAPTRATLPPSTCETATEDGSPLHVEYQTGVFDLLDRGERLRYSIGSSATLTGTGDSVQLLCLFDGTRIE